MQACGGISPEGLRRGLCRPGRSAGSPPAPATLWDVSCMRDTITEAASCSPMSLGSSSPGGVPEMRLVRGGCVKVIQKRGAI